MPVTCASSPPRSAARAPARGTVAADAEILIRPPLRRQRSRFLDEARLVPAIDLAHPLGMSRVDRLVRGIAAQRFEDVDQALVHEIADRQPRLDATRVHAAVGLDRDLRAVEAVARGSRGRPTSGCRSCPRASPSLSPFSQARPRGQSLPIQLPGCSAEEVEHGARLPRASSASAPPTPHLAHPVALEQPRELLHERALPGLALQPDVEVVDARDRDHPDAAREQRPRRSHR